jgi:hypothetical protein
MSGHLVHSGFVDVLRRCLASGDEVEARALRLLSLLDMTDCEPLLRDSTAGMPYEDRQEVRRRASAALAHRGGDRRRQIGDALDGPGVRLWRDDARTVVDAVSTTWLEGEGISVPDLCLISAFCSETEVERVDGAPMGAGARVFSYCRQENDDPPVMSVMISLSPGVYWYEGAVHFTDVLPETMIAAGTGSRLGSVLTHPHLDRFDLSIVDMDEDTITTDAAWLPVFGR